MIIYSNNLKCNFWAIINSITQRAAGGMVWNHLQIQMQRDRYKFQDTDTCEQQLWRLHLYFDISLILRLWLFWNYFGIQGN